MSMNLALKKGETLDFTPYQTPSHISYKAMESKDPTLYYKQWVLAERAGDFIRVETEDHFKEIDSLLADGYYWTIT